MCYNRKSEGGFMEKREIEAIVRTAERGLLEHENDLFKINHKDFALLFVLVNENDENLETRTAKIFETCDLETARKFVDYIFSNLRVLINDFTSAKKADHASYSLREISAIDKSIHDVVCEYNICMVHSDKERLQFVRANREGFGGAEYYSLKAQIQDNDFEAGMRIAKVINDLKINHKVSASKLYVREYSLYGERVADDLFDMAINSLKEAITKIGVVKKMYVKPALEFKEYLSSEEFLGSKRKSLKR